MLAWFNDMGLGIMGALDPLIFQRYSASPSALSSASSPDSARLW